MNSLDPDNRLGYGGDLNSAIESATAFFKLGGVVELKQLEEGYEDCNIQVETKSGKYVCKFFANNQLGDYSKTRRGSDVTDRLVDINLAARANGVNVPKLIMGKMEYLFRYDGLVALCYEWIEGSSYYDMGRVPSENELSHIVEQAALLNTTDLQPYYYHDIWAVPHIHALASKVEPYFSDDDRKLIAEVLLRFDAIRMDELPKCLVHGDLTKGNVLLGKDGLPYIIDFSVTNWTTRIIELILIVSNLLYDEKDKRTLKEKAAIVVEMYQKHNQLTDREIGALPDASLVGSAMEFLGALWRQKFMGDTSEETKYWLELGRKTLNTELNS